MRPILVALVAAAIVLAPSAPALAQPKPQSGKSELNLPEAKRLFDEGAESYTHGNYEAAIGDWEKSYTLSQKPLIFENIANAYERLGNPRKAREYLLKWKAVAPAEEQGILDARLKNLDARVAHEEEVEAARKLQEEKAKREREEAARRAALQKQPGLSVPGVVLMSVGGAAVVVGVVLDVVAFTQRSELSAACAASKGGQICLASARDQISSSNTLATVGDVVWITGAAAAAAGLGLVIANRQGAGPAKDAAPKTAFVPMVTPRAAGVFFQQQF